MKAVFIGSISAMADTSEMQRDAFNRAFAEAGLDWHWTRDGYRDRLKDSGGRDRIAAYADEMGVAVDADAIHARKTKIFQEKLRTGAAQLRPHTQAILEHAIIHHLKAAFVSGTSADSLDALMAGFGGAEVMGISLVTSENDGAAKPDPALYLYALDQLGLDAVDVVAIEDNRPGVDAARAAGIKVLAYPNENTADHDFSDVDGIEIWPKLLT